MADSDLSTECDGMGVYESKNGAIVLTLDFVADPGKRDPEWIRSVTRGMDRRAIRQEYYRDKTVHTGLPVYEDWNDKLHLPAEYRRARLPIARGALWFGGWDAGETMNQAFVLVQFHPQIRQIQVAHEFLGFNTSLDVFCPALQRFLAKHYRDVPFINHVGDPDILRRSGHTAINADTVLRKHGFRVKTSTNSWAARHSAVSWALTDRIESGDDDEYVTPRMIISQYGCPVLTDAMRGAYKWEETAMSESAWGPAAMYKSRPRKDFYSHIANALEYVAVELQQVCQRGVPSVQRRWSGI